MFLCPPTADQVKDALGQNTITTESVLTPEAVQWYVDTAEKYISQYTNGFPLDGLIAVHDPTVKYDQRSTAIPSMLEPIRNALRIHKTTGNAGPLVAVLSPVVGSPPARLAAIEGPIASAAKFTATKSMRTHGGVHRTVPAADYYRSMSRFVEKYENDELGPEVVFTADGKPKTVKKKGHGHNIDEARKAVAEEKLIAVAVVHFKDFDRVTRCTGWDARKARAESAFGEACRILEDNADKLHPAALGSAGIFDDATNAVNNAFRSVSETAANLFAMVVPGWAGNVQQNSAVAVLKARQKRDALMSGGLFDMNCPKTCETASTLVEDVLGGFELPGMGHAPPGVTVDNLLAYMAPLSNFVRPVDQEPVYFCQKPCRHTIVPRAAVGGGAESTPMVWVFGVDVGDLRAYHMVFENDGAVNALTAVTYALCKDMHRTLRLLRILDENGAPIGYMTEAATAGRRGETSVHRILSFGEGGGDSARTSSDLESDSDSESSASDSGSDSD